MQGQNHIKFGEETLKLEEKDTNVSFQ